MQQEARPQTGSCKELNGMQLLQKHSQYARIVHVLQHSSHWNKSWCFARFSAGPGQDARRGTPQQYSLTVPAREISSDNSNCSPEQ